MPTRCNRCFLLQILLLAQHVSGTIMPIIRSSRVLYKWLLPVVFGAWFSSCRHGVKLRVVCPVCGQNIFWHPVCFWCTSIRNWINPTGTEIHRIKFPKLSNFSDISIEHFPVWYAIIIPWTCWDVRYHFSLDVKKWFLLRQWTIIATRAEKRTITLHSFELHRTDTDCR